MTLYTITRWRQRWLNTSSDFVFDINVIYSHELGVILVLDLREDMCLKRFSYFDFKVALPVSSHLGNRA